MKSEFIMLNTKLLLALSLVLSSATIASAEDYPSTQAFDNRTVGKIDVKIENLPEGSSFDRKVLWLKCLPMRETIFPNTFSIKI